MSLTRGLETVRDRCTHLEARVKRLEHRQQVLYNFLRNSEYKSFEKWLEHGMLGLND